MDEKDKYINTWLNGGKAPPFMLEIRPTNNCNLNCLPCKARGKSEFISKEENISNEQYINLIRDASKLGVKRIQITGGGEPLCRKELTFSIMRTIKKYKIDGALVTNGTLFTKSMIKELVKIGWDTILFSINGPNKEIDDYLRGKKGAFEKSIETINLFTYLKKKLKKEKPKLNLVPVLNNKNFSKLNEFVELANKFDMNSIVLQPLEVKNNKLGNMLKLNEKQKKEYKYNLKNMIKLANKYHIYVNFNDMDDGLSKEERRGAINQDFKAEENKLLPILCYEPFQFMLVNVNGEVYPCHICSTPDDKINFGNIKDKNLKDIWYGEHFNNFRKDLINKNLSYRCKKFCVLQSRKKFTSELNHF